MTYTAYRSYFANDLEWNWFLHCVLAEANGKSHKDFKDEDFEGIEEVEITIDRDETEVMGD